MITIYKSVILVAVMALCGSARERLVELDLRSVIAHARRVEPTGGMTSALGLSGSGTKTEASGFAQEDFTISFTHAAASNAASGYLRIELRNDSPQIIEIPISPDPRKIEMTDRNYRYQRLDLVLATEKDRNRTMIKAVPLFGSTKARGTIYSLKPHSRMYFLIDAPNNQNNIIVTAILSDNAFYFKGAIPREDSKQTRRCEAKETVTIRP